MIVVISPVQHGVLCRELVIPSIKSRGLMSRQSKVKRELRRQQEAVGYRTAANVLADAVRDKSNPEHIRKMLALAVVYLEHNIPKHLVR